MQFLFLLVPLVMFSGHVTSDRSRGYYYPKYKNARFLHAASADIGDEYFNKKLPTMSVLSHLSKPYTYKPRNWVPSPEILPLQTENRFPLERRDISPRILYEKREFRPSYRLYKNSNRGRSLYSGEQLDLEDGNSEYPVQTSDRHPYIVKKPFASQLHQKDSVKNYQELKSLAFRHRAHLKRPIYPPQGSPEVLDPVIETRPIERVAETISQDMDTYVPKHYASEDRNTYVPKHYASEDINTYVPHYAEHHPERYRNRVPLTDLYSASASQDDNIDKRVVAPYVDDHSAKFFTKVQNVYDEYKAGSGEGRISFQVVGHKGPHSYKFGFDTGAGPNRMFRFEEKDGDGQVTGSYGSNDGVVNYKSDSINGYRLVFN